MKYSCEIIKDLLPLYIDNCCSLNSRKVVEDHLAECADCRREWQLATAEVFPSKEIFQTEEANGCRTKEATSAHAMKRGLEKIIRVWLASLLAVTLLVLIGVLGWNQARGSGIGFTNLNQLRLAYLFVDALAERDYEGAFQQLSLEYVREHYVNNWFDEEDLVHFERDAKDVFLDCTQALEQAGGITDYQFVSIHESGDFEYRIKYMVKLAQNIYELSIDVNPKGVCSIMDYDGLLREPSPLTTIGLWSEYLWELYAERYFESDGQGNIINKYGWVMPMTEFWKYAPVEINIKEEP